MLEAQPHAATDVTGYGLLGHLHGMLRGSAVQATLQADAIPFLADVAPLAERGCVPGGTHANHRFMAAQVAWGDIPLAEQLVIADAQTSGGLLIALPESRLTVLLNALERERTPARAIIGRVHEGASGRIDVQGRLRNAVTA